MSRNLSKFKQWELGKESLYIVSKFNPLNMDSFYTPPPPLPPPASLSVLTGFHCITKRAGFIINCDRCYELWCSPSPPSLRIPIQQSPFLSLSFTIYVPSLKVTQSICICWVEFRLFTVLYFSERSSRSSALRYGLRHLAWVSKLVRGRGWLPGQHSPPRYIRKSKWPPLTVRRTVSRHLTKK